MKDKSNLSSIVSEKANLIWAVADKLTGAYKPHEYGLVTLPMTVIKRFDSVLEGTKKDVLDAAEKYKSYPNPEIILRKAAKYPFYNTSKYTLKTLLDEPDHIVANFRNYLNGFSQNILEILSKFNFDVQITKMAEKGLLYQVIHEFCTPKADLHPDYVNNNEMGYIFEELVRRFSESHNEDAGQHYTPREVIELMANILFSEDSEALSGNGVTKTLYDPACGTGGMLSVAREYLENMNSDLELLCYGQEFNDETFAICKADVLIKGGDADQIKCADTLSNDQFPSSQFQFDYILSNPPFGREWKIQKTSVEAEAKLGYTGRFGPGLPSISDSQMLFLLTVIAKMKPNGGRAAIIHNGSPLFTGDAGSGPSEIRKWILETDILDAIIALPNDIFYNTGIATYIWVLSNKKPPYRKGKVQLINANLMFEKRRKPLGNKRNDIPKSAIDEITKVYGEFKENEISKIVDSTTFGYSKIVVERPLKDANGNLVLKKGKPQPDPALRDTEYVPLDEDICEYLEREVKPYVNDNLWVDDSKTKIGYEIPFTRYFYKFNPPRKSEEIKKEILNLEKELENDFKKIFE